MKLATLLAFVFAASVCFAQGEGEEAAAPAEAPAAAAPAPTHAHAHAKKMGAKHGKKKMMKKDAEQAE
jgi:hypothetical protein